MNTHRFKVGDYVIIKSSGERRLVTEIQTGLVYKTCNPAKPDVPLYYSEISLEEDTDIKV